MPGTARDKLNAATVLGAALTAAVAGFFTQSWIAFLFTFALLLATGYLAGDMRLTRRGDDRRKR